MVLPEADPILTKNLHEYGLIETLYIRKPDYQLKHFPIGLKTAISRYFSGYAKGKEVFLQYYNNHPELNQTGLSCPAIKLIIMGISNEQYPTKDGAANIHYDKDDLVRVDAELTIGILRKLVYMNDFFRLNYKSDSTLLLTKSTKEFDIQEIIGPIVYKIWDNGIIKSLQYHQTMCRLLIQSQLQDKISEKHKCPICTDKSEEAQEEKAQEDSSDDPIIEDEATPTKAINM